MTRITVWNEYLHEKEEKIAAIYPQGIHSVIAGFLQKETDFTVRTATLEEAEHGLTDDALENTDVLIWWGHMAHGQVSDCVVEKVYERVLGGMGLVVLHSGHKSKIFMKLMGTTCSLRWREADENMRLWTIEPSHPIAQGIPDNIEIEAEEMYGERFDIPVPDALVFAGWFKGGEVFRSGCCFTRGAGKIFYFQPGHETYPIYKNEYIQKIIVNAARWARSEKRASSGNNPKGQSAPMEKIDWQE